MGCDIHTLAERSYEYDGETHWVAITEPVFPYEYYDEERPIVGYNHPYDKRPITGRNYRLFSLLADVRNSSGIVPIKQPTGVPDDATRKWKKYVKRLGDDLHSRTSYTVQELLEAVAAGKFQQTVHEVGDVREDQYLVFRDHGVFPKTWAHPFPIWNNEIVTAEQYEQGLRPSSTYGGRVRLEWDWNIGDHAFGFFLEKTLPALQLQGDPDKVRVQIAFDN